MMVSELDYLSIADARTDLRLDGDGFSDAVLTRYIRSAVALVAELTGRDLLGIEVAAIDDGLRHCVSVALWSRFEGTSEVPPALYALTSPYRVIVSADDTDTDSEDQAMATLGGLTVRRLVTVAVPGDLPYRDDAGSGFVVFLTGPATLTYKPLGNSESRTDKFRVGVVSLGDVPSGAVAPIIISEVSAATGVESFTVGYR